MVSKRIFQLLLVSLGVSQLAQGNVIAQHMKENDLAKRQLGIGLPLLGITIGATPDPMTSSPPPETTSAGPSTTA